MDVTKRYLLAFSAPYARVLDFGCGCGDVVIAGRQSGMNIQGADVFYGGSAGRKPDDPDVVEIVNGIIPFPDASFDLVVNNQVMEHVSDLTGTLEEIHRVLRPGGTVLSLFPAEDVWREGHIGIPFSHRFPKGSKARFYYTWALRGMGFGTWKEQAPNARQWALDKLRWLDLWTYYRPRSEILSCFDRYFTSEFAEYDYIRYRLLDRPSLLRRWAAFALDFRLAAQLGSALFRRLAFLVIVSKKPEK